MPSLELSLAPRVYHALEQEARQRNESLEAVVEAAVASFLDKSNVTEPTPQLTPSTNGATRRAKIHLEAKAWRALPERERQQYQGQFVAVHQGQVIDHDTDRLHLYQRLRQRLGDTPVLITPADPSHPREFRLLSPRLNSVA